MDQKKKVDWTVLSLTAAAFSDWFLFGMTKEIQSETQLMCQSLSECGSETVRGRTRRLDALLSERQTCGDNRAADFVAPGGSMPSYPNVPLRNMLRIGRRHLRWALSRRPRMRVFFVLVLSCRNPAIRRLHGCVQWDWDAPRV